MKNTTHNTEQAARGYLMYELARRGYNIQLTDSRFPVVDMLVVSPEGRYFGIDVKGQRTKNFWLFKECEPSIDRFYAFIYLSETKSPRVFIMNSPTAMKLFYEYRARCQARNPNIKDQFWGVNWTTPHEYEDRFDLLPK